MRGVRPGLLRAPRHATRHSTAPSPASSTWPDARVAAAIDGGASSVRAVRGVRLPERGVRWAAVPLRRRRGASLRTQRRSEPGGAQGPAAALKFPFFFISCPPDRAHLHEDDGAF